MNQPKLFKFASEIGLLGLLMMICLGSEYLHRAAYPWQFVNQVRDEVVAAFKATDVQWLIVLFIAAYLAWFIWLHRSRDHCIGEHRGALRILGLTSYNQRRELQLLFGWEVRELAAIIFFAYCALAYALRYEQASKSTDCLVLLFGIMLFFGFRLWRAIEDRRRWPFPITDSVINITLSLLCISVIWHPATFTSFQYRGQARWTGLWDNPNTFGVLMGVGVTLALGQFISIAGCQVLLRKSDHRAPKSEDLTLNEVQRSTAAVRIQNPQSTICKWAAWGKVLFYALTTLVCGVGLVESYSRGAWLGTMCGLVVLGYQTVKFQIANPIGRFSWLATLVCRTWLPTSVILMSALVLACWNYRHTENVKVRRVFSASQMNDFSWRNRVAAWTGSLQMMTERPMLGYGWKGPEQIYDQFYRPPKIDEGMAIQLNDYFALATTLGIPASVCFFGFIGLSLFHKPEGRNKIADLQIPIRALSFQCVCCSSAIVLLVGFWFDGGLFKLATGTMFWTLLELSSVAKQPLPSYLSASG